MEIKLLYSILISGCSTFEMFDLPREASTLNPKPGRRTSQVLSMVREFLRMAALRDPCAI